LGDWGRKRCLFIAALFSFDGMSAIKLSKNLE
jgi:hypothetical protein